MAPELIFFFYFNYILLDQNMFIIFLLLKPYIFSYSFDHALIRFGYCWFLDVNCGLHELQSSTVSKDTLQQGIIKPYQVGYYRTCDGKYHRLIVCFIVFLVSLLLSSIADAKKFLKLLVSFVLTNIQCHFPAVIKAFYLKSLK